MHALRIIWKRTRTAAATGAAGCAGRRLFYLPVHLQRKIQWVGQLSYSAMPSFELRAEVAAAATYLHTLIVVVGAVLMLVLGPC